MNHTSSGSRGRRRFHEHQPILPLHKRLGAVRVPSSHTHPHTSPPPPHPGILLLFTKSHIFSMHLKFLETFHRLQRSSHSPLAPVVRIPERHGLLWGLYCLHRKLRSALSHHRHLSRFLPAGNVKLQRPGMLTLVCCTRAPAAGYDGGKVS